MKYSKKRLLAMMLISSIGFSTVSYADSLKSLENKKNATQKSANELKNSINSLEAEKNNLSSEVSVLDQEISGLEAQINELKSQISSLEVTIQETIKEMEELEEKLDKNQKEFEERVSAMYMSSQVGYLDIVFSSSDVDDLISKASTIKFITEHDKEIIKNLKNDKLLVDAKKDELEGQKLSLEVSKQTLDNKNTQLYASKASKLALIESASSEQAVSQAELSKLESEITSLEGSINSEKAAQAQAAAKAAREKAEKAKAAANNSSSGQSSVSRPPVNYDKNTISSNLGSGTLGWPVPATRNISSGYGYRVLFGMPEFHMGIDIPSGLGTPVVSAESGTVIYSAPCGSYGNLMKVQHDNGLVTYYAHLSSFVASTGQRVSKGQTIALMGSTGNSTGSHLHFEVRVNGAHTNPLNYVR